MHSQSVQDASDCSSNRQSETSAGNACNSASAIRSSSGIICLQISVTWLRPALSAAGSQRYSSTDDQLVSFNETGLSLSQIGNHLDS